MSLLDRIGRRSDSSDDGGGPSVSSGSAPTARAIPPIIQLKQVSRVYDTGRIQVPALQNVNLRVEDGEFMAIIGPSGSGKSTMMNILGCLDRPTSGRYVLDGQFVDELDNDGLAFVRGHSIGFVFQSYNLLPRTTALENVATPLMYQGVPRKERLARSQAALERLGLGDRMHHEPSELSGGQQQRVGIARALVTDPALILADEPTGNLDSHSGSEVLTLFRDLHAIGRTIVLITHDPDVATAADRVVHLRDGEPGRHQGHQRPPRVARHQPPDDQPRLQPHGGQRHPRLVRRRDHTDPRRRVGRCEAERRGQDRAPAVHEQARRRGHAERDGPSRGYLSVNAYQMWTGTFLNDASVENNLRVAVIGSTTADNLGLKASDVNATTINIGGLPFELIGIMQPKGGTSSSDDIVLIPVSTAHELFVGSNSVSSIGVSANSQADISYVQAEITALLEQRHGISSSGSDDFTITTQAQLLGTVSSVSDVLTFLLAGIASISLLVGGIGIMNIMLVSVRERTREIGIRKAIGARGRDILSQFLVEALALSLTGGAIGIGLGVVASFGIGVYAGWGFVFNPFTVVVALGFSTTIGIVFGVWPASQAASLDPVVALRYE